MRMQRRPGNDAAAASRALDRHGRPTIAQLHLELGRNHFRGVGFIVQKHHQVHIASIHLSLT